MHRRHGLGTGRLGCGGGCGAQLLPFPRAGRGGQGAGGLGDTDEAGGGGGGGTPKPGTGALWGGRGERGGRQWRTTSWGSRAGGRQGPKSKEKQGWRRG